MTSTIPEKATYPQFTNLKLNEGLVDQLMATVAFHTQKEFSEQRITGADYAKVYLGALESVMANSTQYLLGTMLLEAQREKIAAEIKLLELEGEKLRYEIDYMYPAQLIKLQQEGLLIESQIRLSDAKVLETEANIRKIEAEILMLESQKLLIDAQIRKIDQEILFLQAKVNTENANVDDANIDAGSIIGRQTALLKAQKLGFAGDLYIKQAKVHSDYAAVWMSVIEDENSPYLTTNISEGAYSGYNEARSTADAIESIP
jgi:hypothetical protein